VTAFEFNLVQRTRLQRIRLSRQAPDSLKSLVGGLHTRPGKQRLAAPGVRGVRGHALDCLRRQDRRGRRVGEAAVGDVGFGEPMRWRAPGAYWLRILLLDLRWRDTLTLFVHSVAARTDTERRPR
jgi:hypothetical protein